MNPITRELYGEDIRNIGFVLADRRRELGLTQRQLRERGARHQTRISDLERGLTDPRLSSLIRHAEALGCRFVIRLVPNEEAP